MFLEHDIYILPILKEPLSILSWRGRAKVRDIYDIMPCSIASLMMGLELLFKSSLGGSPQFIRATLIQQILMRHVRKYHIS